MKSQTQGQTKDADGVFNHTIGVRGAQEMVAMTQGLGVLGADNGLSFEQVDALGHCFAVKPR